MAPRMLALLAGGLAACGGDDGPADVAGDYTIVLTNRDNGCNLTNWEVGRQSAPVSVIVVQSGDAVAMDVQGVAASGLDFALGSHTFHGDVTGSDVEATILGTREQSQGACTFRYDATIRGTLTGDNLNGRVDYEARTNQAADCGALEGCVSFQEFAGARAPR